MPERMPAPVTRRDFVHTATAAAAALAFPVLMQASVGVAPVATIVRSVR